jgi:hypothetical protein
MIALPCLPQMIRAFGGRFDMGFVIPPEVESKRRVAR